MRKLWMLCFSAVLVAGCGSPQDNVPKERAQTSSQQPFAVASAQSQRHLSQAIQNLQEADLPAAIKNFDEAIKADPANPRPYLLLGQTYLRLNQVDRAIDTFTAASRVAPDQGEIFYMLAISHGLAGNFEEAVPNVQRSIEIFHRMQDTENLQKALALLQSFTQTEKVSVTDTSSKSKVTPTAE